MFNTSQSDTAGGCISSSDWQYRAEGNRSVVIFSKKSRRIQRLLKAESDTNGFMKEKEELTTLKWYSRLVQYIACVMDRLYGEFIVVPVLVDVEFRFLENIDRAILSDRPGFRQNKRIALASAVVEMTDHAFLPASFTLQPDAPHYMFELKPGCVVRLYNHGKALLSPKQFVCDLSGESKCYFCLNKLAEVKESDKRTSRYCPFELFSGNKQRMRRCIKWLLEDINSFRNRLRIFKNGENVTSSITDTETLINQFTSCSLSSQHSGSLTLLVDVLFSCLTHSKKMTSRRRLQPCAATSVPLDVNAANVSDTFSLPSNCILSVFANAQLFGAGNVSHVKRAYEILQSAIAKDPTVEEKLCINGPYDTGLWRLSAVPERPAGISEAVMKAFVTVRNYLIYRTAKDSSILVTFVPAACRSQPVRCRNTFSNNVFVVSDSIGNSYYCSTAIIDLDPKPFSKMSQYLSREQQILELATSKDQQL